MPGSAIVDTVVADIVLDGFDRITAKLYLQVRNRATSKAGDWKFLSAYDNEDDAYNMGGDPPVWRLVYIANNGGLPAFGRGEGVDVYAKMSNNNVAYITSCTVLAYY